VPFGEMLQVYIDLRFCLRGLDLVVSGSRFFEVEKFETIDILRITK